MLIWHNLIGLELVLKEHTFAFSDDSSLHIMVFSEACALRRRPFSSMLLKLISFSLD